MSGFTYPLSSYLVMPHRQVVVARSEREALAILREHPGALGFAGWRVPTGALALGMTRLFSERSCS